WTFQYLNALNVEELKVEGLWIYVVEAVDIDSNVRALAGGYDGRAHAADRGLQLLCRDIEAHCRRERLYIGETLDVGVCQLIGSHVGYGDGHVLKALGAPLGSYC